MREFLPLPDLIVRLYADEGVVTERLSRRKRINIANADDTAQFNSYLDEWLAAFPSHQVLVLDVTNEKIGYERSTDIILDKIRQNF